MIIQKKHQKKERKNPFGTVNLSTIASLKFLEGAHPKFAKHMFLRNSLVEMFAKEKFGGVELLDLPMCERCEKPGAWHDNDTCYCFPCGHTTPAKNTKPLRQWLMQDIKEYGFGEAEMELLEAVTSDAIKNPEIEHMIDKIQNMSESKLEDIIYGIT